MDPATFPLLITIALAPGLFILWYIYHADKYEKEPLQLVFKIYLLGAAITLPALVLEYAAAYLIEPIRSTLLGIFLYFFLAVSLIEELSKFYVMKKYAYTNPEFNEPMDGIIYGVTAALGFASLENLAYVFQYGVETGLLRAFTSVPAHAIWGGIIGFYLGKAKFNVACKRGGEMLCISRGLVIAIISHGIYDVIAVELGSIVGLLLLLALLLYLWRELKKHIQEALEASPFKESTVKQNLY